MGPVELSARPVGSHDVRRSPIEYRKRKLAKLIRGPVLGHLQIKMKSWFLAASRRLGQSRNWRPSS
jgi:hypothetical protein